MSESSTRAELEARLRPGIFSKLGFLGVRESLDDVLARDAQTLENQGLTHAKVADSLEEVLSSALNQLNEMLKSENIEEYRRRFPHLPNLYSPDPLQGFFDWGIPDPDLGCRVGHLQIFHAQYRGYQGCPWGCDVSPRWGSFDFLIWNRKVEEYVTGPGLIVHLIRDHHFFEGLESPFRMDPLKAVRVLELIGVENL